MKTYNAYLSTPNGYFDCADRLPSLAAAKAWASNRTDYRPYHIEVESSHDADNTINGLCLDCWELKNGTHKTGRSNGWKEVKW